MDLATNDKDKAISWLLIGTIFFVVCSCKYLQTQTKESYKRIHILRLKNIKFKKNGKLLYHAASNLHAANIVQNQSVHMFWIDDNVLKPALAWVKTVNRLLTTISKANGDTLVCVFWDGKNMHFQLTLGLIKTKSSSKTNRERKLRFSKG